MNLKDLTVELLGNDQLRNRSVKIGPLSDRLNFIYGENGAGKSTLRKLVTGLLLNSKSSGSHTLKMVIDCNSGTYKADRDEFGNPKFSQITEAVGSNPDSFGASDPTCVLDSELAACLSFVPFRYQSNAELQNLHAVLHRRLSVPFGSEAATDGNTVPPQQKIELQSRIDSRTSELVQLNAQRVSLESETYGWPNGEVTSELDQKINELSLRLVEMEPNRIRLEIETLQQESSRLRAEIDRASLAATTENPSRHPKLLYRLLDEIDQQLREVRSVQSHIQRHRVRLKGEMELLNSLTIEEDGHPYHRASEILRQIENRIDNADTRGDQWLDDHGTADVQQVSRFIDETCRSLRSDLHTLCDELSGRYREMQCRSATSELKELRHTYSHLSELTQQVISRREGLLREISEVDAPGADLIRQSNPEFCQVARQAGHFAARQQFLGAQPVVSEVTRDTSLQQQQLNALENRLGSLRSSLGLSEAEALRITTEINELNLKKSNLSSVFRAERSDKLAKVVAQIHIVESDLRVLTAQLEELNLQRYEAHPLLIAASDLLGQLTQGEYTKIWLESNPQGFQIQNRLGQVFGIESLEERGLKQLAQLSLVLAANTQPQQQDAPLILDDLFADLRKDRVDATLGVLARWCGDHQRQAVVLTQHRFLADRLADAPSFEIDLGYVHESRNMPQSLVNEVSTTARVAPTNTRLNSNTESWRDDFAFDAPIAEYPSGPMPRPYPLSKYPRTTDRGRQSAVSNVDYFENFAQPEVQVETSPEHHNGFVEVNTSGRTTVISPSEVGDRYEPPTINESTSVDSIALFDGAQLRCLEENEIFTVIDFLTLDPQDSDEWAACYLVGQSLEYLQSSLWLMCWVPGLTANDAQALVACGISDPEHLLTSNVDSLYERLARFLRSPDGRRFGSSGNSPNRNTVRSWQVNLRNNRNYSRQQRPRPTRAQRSRGERQTIRAWNPVEAESTRGDRSYARERNLEERPQRRTVRRESMPIRSPRMRTPEPADAKRSVAAIAPREPRTPRKPAAVRQSRARQSFTGNESELGSRSRSKSKPSAQKLRFYLDLNDHIEAAPSIGPKTAARFEAIGVHTIQEFLKMTAESMAEKLDYKRLNANLVRQYQNQTRLVCRVPNLRGHDAQLLVGCGIIEPEELASMRPDALFAKIAPFSDTKEGLKIIRNGKKPDLAEVTDWISFAQHNRSIQAA